MTENNDVDLYEDLKKELDKPEEEETIGASAEKPNKEDEPNKEIINEDGDLSEDEISKLSPRAQKRIREQADKIKELSEKPEAKTEDKEIVPESKPHEFNDVEEFLKAVQDEPSRKLLETFANVLKKENSTILAPLEAKNNEARFETTFSKYEKIEGFGDYKDELKKTFLRDTKQDIDSLFAKTVVDLTLNKIKPSLNTESKPNRDGKVDLEGASLEQLYDALDKTR